MTEKINLKVSGWVQVLINDKLVIDQHNEIQPKAVECILRGLANVPTNLAVDKIVFNDSVAKTIVDTLVDPSDGSIMFKTVLLEEDFDGIITDIRLKMDVPNLTFSIIEGLSEEKDNASRAEVRWKILIGTI